jgi:CheY-like chemotaxis protein
LNGSFTRDPRASGKCIAFIYVRAWHVFCVRCPAVPSVLIVDDDPSVVDALRRVLPAGVELSSATSATDAATLLDGQPFCGLVLDLVLTSSSGFDVLRHMKERGMDVPCVIVSANVPSYVREMLDQDQVKLVLPKPIESRLLAAVVLGLCGMS